MNLHLVKPTALHVPLDVQGSKHARELERQKVSEETGLRFVTIRCIHPGCLFEADGMGATEGIAEGRAVNGIVAHVVAEHNGSAA